MAINIQPSKALSQELYRNSDSLLLIMVSENENVQSKDQLSSIRLFGVKSHIDPVHLLLKCTTIWQRIYSQLSISNKRRDVRVKARSLLLSSGIAARNFGFHVTFGFAWNWPKQHWHYLFTLPICPWKSFEQKSRTQFQQNRLGVLKVVFQWCVFFTYVYVRMLNTRQ